MTSVYDKFIFEKDLVGRNAQKQATELLIEHSKKNSRNSIPLALSAPTGTGKSYSALLAGVDAALSNNGRVVIGTSTVVLSDQYVADIAAIADVFNVSFAVLKGASNMYCGNKWESRRRIMRNKQSKLREMESQLLAAVRGERKMPPFAAADAEECSECIELLGAGDIRGEACEYAKARLKALQSDVVVTTHAMICIDLTQKIRDNSATGGVLGQVGMVIFDEGHDAARSISYDEKLSLRDVNNLSFNGFMNQSYAARDRFVELFGSDGVLNDRDSFWNAPDEKIFNEVLSRWPTSRELDRMENYCETMTSGRAELRRSLGFLRRSLSVLTDANPDGDMAFWFSRGTAYLRGMEGSGRSVQALNEQWYYQVAYMSATLGSHSSPLYSLEKAGLRGKLVELETPFDWGKQLEWTVRVAGVGCTDNQGEFVRSVGAERAGGTVVLVSSHRRKDAIAQYLSGVGEIDVRWQELNDNAATKDVITKHAEACAAGRSGYLIGVQVLSTGMDLPGDGLTKLVLAGLAGLKDGPAYTAWRKRWLRSRGMDPFADYELPERAVTVEQQVGRVVRRETDSGIAVFYLDSESKERVENNKRIIEEVMKRFEGAKYVY